MSEQRTGRPGPMTLPPDAKISDAVVKAPDVRLDNSVIGRPAPVIDTKKIAPVAKPGKAEAPAEVEYGWSRIEIDLGPSTDHISINGQPFEHGRVYTVRDDLVPVLMETMYNTKMHEAVVKGQASPTGRRLQVGGRF